MLVVNSGGQKQSRLVSLLSCLVAVTMSFVLMVPAVGLTRDSAEAIGVMQGRQFGAIGKVAHTPVPAADTEDIATIMFPFANAQDGSEDKDEPSGSSESVEPADSEESEPAGDEPGGDEPGGDGPGGDESGSDLPDGDGPDSDESGDAGHDDQSGDAEPAEKPEDSSDASPTEDETTNSDDEKSDASADSSSSETATDDSDELPEEMDSSEGVVDPDSEDQEMPAQSFKADLKDNMGLFVLTVAVEAPDGAFPKDTLIQIENVSVDKILDKVNGAVKNARGENFEVRRLTAVDIVFKDADGKEIEPEKPVQVRITSDDVCNFENPILVHVLDKSKESSKGKGADAEVIENVAIVNESGDDHSVGIEDTMEFESEAFSPYAIVEIVDTSLEDVDESQTSTEDEGADDDEHNIITSEDDDEGEDAEEEAEEPRFITTDSPEALHAIRARTGDYKITVIYSGIAGVPEGATLEAQEIVESMREYQEYATAAEDALGMEEGSASTIRLFDIKIVDADGNKVEITAPVDVKIELAENEDLADAQVVHFPDNGDGEVEPQVVESVTAENDAVSFGAEGFSVYAIVEGPEETPIGWDSAIADLAEMGEQGLYIGHVDGYYFTGKTMTISTGRTGITKTKPAKNFPDVNGGAVKYYLEAVDVSKGQFKIYCKDGENAKYVVQSTNSLKFVSKPEQAMVFTISQGSEENTYRIEGTNGYFWNMQGGANGKAFAAYQSATDVNAQLRFWSYVEPQTDPYGIDRTTRGLMSWNGAASGKAMMAESVNASSGKGALNAKQLTVMTKKEKSVYYHFIPKDGNDITLWTFEWAGLDQYYLKAGEKYLQVNSGGISLVTTPDDDCKLQLVTGTGVHEGQVCFKSGDVALTYSGEVGKDSEGQSQYGFSVGGGVGSEWLSFVDTTEDDPDYFMTYSAEKVSISDEARVRNGSKVIVYTRFWNESAKTYEFYAIDYDGSLVPCFETGDSIEWVGGKLNTMLWQFTEYYNEGTTVPNYYYELYSEYGNKYIAPQVTGDQVLSRNPIGINLNGRRDGQYYSSILAWDDPEYVYAGLKAIENDAGKMTLVPCPKSDPDMLDFYFAIVEDVPVDDTLHTVPTVDHTQYGITMKLKDFGTREQMSSYLGNDAGGMGTELRQGLLSTDLSDGKEGYPAAAGGSLGGLFSGAQEVNNLFIDSTYYASGYFEFDSSQNFATLNNGDGNFSVYKELGSYDSAGSRTTLKHGQFFPFNDLEPGLFCSVNTENLYSTTGSLLSNGNPRKNEKLYLIRDVDCYFGMELTASFTQTENGLDHWGHDIIFEFSGDDDFWLYVDGELVIDLGGIHSAVPGSVNFRTGKVYINKGNPGGYETTLRDLFYNNYKKRGHTAAQAQAYVDDLFQLNSDGQWVFKDYTTHTMRIFYMERGAGASNLHMRFNLASVKPGTVELTKELAGVDDIESVFAEFPYQILYKTSDDEGAPEYLLTNAIPNDPNYTDDHVFYKEKDSAVTFQKHITIGARSDGTGGVEYDDVFLLKPGETAIINLPEETTSYRVVECGVNTSVFSSTTVKEVDGANVDVEDHDGRKDYGIPFAPTNDRPRVTYVNNVDPNALKTLTIKKELYDEHGTTPISYNDDQTTFNFRLYLGSEFEDAAILTNMHAYHVKNEQGYDCMWAVDPAPPGESKRFVSTGKTDFSKLTSAERSAATFHTSPYGQISKIPAFYTVEIRNVLAGTKYRVEERLQEIPDGYSFKEYGHLDSAEEVSQNVGGVMVLGVNGVAASNEDDPYANVANLKGWGLRVKKVWTDADYMQVRDPAYFAVFIKDANNAAEEDGSLTLVEGTMKEMPYGAPGKQTLYWYFQHLEPNVDFDRYVVRELTVVNPTVDENGLVTQCDSYRIIPDAPENNTLQISGRQKGETAVSNLEYTVTYTKGEIEPGSNVRVDTVTNDRPGVVLKKAEWDGSTPLAGAKFTLQADDSEKALATFISDDEGLITVAFLRDNVEYTLTEVSAPEGWIGLKEPMKIKVQGGEVIIIEGDEDYYVSESGNPPTLTIKDRPYEFKVVKVDDDTKAPISGVHFSLHALKLVNGQAAVDTVPVEGYEDLTTDDEGIVPAIDSTLPAGTYELWENNPIKEGYQKLSSHTRFTVSPTGGIRLVQAPEGVDLAVEEAGDGTVRYELTIPNVPLRKVSFQKVDIQDTTDTLKGAKFDFYRIVDGEREEVYVGDNCLTSGEYGWLATKKGQTLFTLEPGVYHLVETKAPEGYITKTEPVVITVSRGVVDGVPDVIYDEGTALSSDGSGRIYDENKVFTLLISNMEGTELPETGGPGTLPFTIVGSALAVVALLLFVRAAARRRSVR